MNFLNIVKNFRSDPQKLLSLQVPNEYRKTLPKKKIVEWRKKPKYPKASDIRISTMTTTSCLSSLVYMRPIYYLIECLDTKKVQPNEYEKQKLKTINKKNVDLNNLLNLFLNSNRITLNKNVYCPLEYLISQIECYARDYKLKLSKTQLLTIDSIQNLLETLYSCEPMNLKISRSKETKLFQNKTVTDFFVYGIDMDLYPCILDVAWGPCKRGNSELYTKKVAKKRAFYNQCTMRIVLSDFSNILNLKIFKNGNLQITGCKSSDDVKFAIQYLSNQLISLSSTMYYKNKMVKELRMSFINEAGSDAITIITDSDSWKKIFNYCDHIDLTEIERVCSYFYSIFSNNKYWLDRCEYEYGYKFICINEDKPDENPQYKVFSKWYDKFQKFKRIYKSIVFEDAKKFYYSYKTEKKLPFIPLTSFEDLEIKNVNVEMINSDFNVHFYINQNVLANLLRNDPYNMFVKFNPSSYPGVNIKYDCKLEPVGNNSSILVFRTGRIIITGKINMDQLKESYNFINGILKKHYDLLWNPKMPNE